MSASEPPARSQSIQSGSLHDYGLIGNLHTSALVSRFGGVDWACLPRFASPSVFARLLDPGRGGSFEIAPVVKFSSEQSYLPSSNVLLTRFLLGGDRQLDVVDFMPIALERRGEGLPMIVRIAEPRGGPVRVRVVVDPRFDYARERPTWTDGPSGFLASSESSRLWVGSDRPLTEERRRLVGDFELSVGDRLAVEVGWGERRPVAMPSEGLLRHTLGFWQRWVHPATTPLHRIAGRWHAWVERSELVLKLLSHEDTGAFVAAPTASLPEWRGGVRNWDYRYVWIRDAAFTAQALFLLGHLPEAEA
ncbi:MAG: glycoside hydrolase family 15 protein, partial [Thermoplasmata archaeon]